MEDSTLLPENLLLTFINCNRSLDKWSLAFSLLSLSIPIHFCDSTVPSSRLVARYFPEKRAIRKKKKYLLNPFYAWRLTCMCWVSWSSFLLVFLPLFFVVWWPNICQKMGFPGFGAYGGHTFAWKYGFGAVFDKTVRSFHLILRINLLHLFHNKFRPSGGHDFSNKLGTSGQKGVFCD